MIRKTCHHFGKWPHEFELLTVYQQNLALLCMLDHDAATMALAERTGAFPTVEISEVA